MFIDYTYTSWESSYHKCDIYYMYKVILFKYLSGCSNT